jgi:two-component system, OmpR family, phosphate regulon sensor histidine kinase PhoR
MPDIRRGTLASQLLVRYAITVVAILAVLAFVLDRTLQGILLDDLTDSLAAQGRVVRSDLADEPDPLQAHVLELGREIDPRITVIRTDGVVLADSVRDPGTMENHAGRPEVRAALAGRVGVDTRVSETVGRPFRYVALPPTGDRIVRMALPEAIVDARLSQARTLVIGGAALAAIVGVIAVALIARRLARPVRGVTDAVTRMSAGDLAARAPEEGPADLALLATELNRMASDLDARIREVAREREQRDVILSAMEEGVVLIGADGSVSYANPAASRVLRSTPRDVRTLAPHELRALVEDCRAEETAQEREVETGIPTRTIRASAVPIDVTDDVLLVLRDVTASRRVEAMRRDFVADASHELKTPAAAIQAGAETIQRALEGDDEAAAARFAAQVRREAIRLSRIVSDLLDLSRLESERPTMEHVRLDRIVTEEIHRLRQQAAEGGVELEVEAGPVSVRGSSKDLALLVRNLLENAVRYSPEGGRVTVMLSKNSEHVVLAVEDTGIGIPSRDLPRIFERFYRVDRARSRETGGTGLGLSIARHVVEQHGGWIQAQSELGGGSEFTVTLPLS